MTTLIVLGVLVAGGLVLLYRWGLLGKLDETGKYKAGQLINAATTAVEKKKMKINKLKELLDQQGDAVTDLDAQVGTTGDELGDAQKALDKAVQELQDQQTATPDDSKTIAFCAKKVAEAESLRDTKRDLLTQLKQSAEQAHSDYEESLEILTERQNELPKAEAMAVLTRATQIKASIRKQNDAFKKAAAGGDEEDKALRDALHKAEADAKLHGESDEARKVRETQRDKATASVLERYGKKPAAQPEQKK
jgi:hypothetical protein